MKFFLMIALVVTFGLFVLPVDASAVSTPTAVQFTPPHGTYDVVDAVGNVIGHMTFNYMTYQYYGHVNNVQYFGSYCWGEGWTEVMCDDYHHYFSWSVTYFASSTSIYQIHDAPWGWSLLQRPI